MTREYQEGQKVVLNSEELLYENELATVTYASVYSDLVEVRIDSDGDTWNVNRSELSPVKTISE